MDNSTLEYNKRLIGKKITARIGNEEFSGICCEVTEDSVKINHGGSDLWVDLFAVIATN